MKQEWVPVGGCLVCGRDRGYHTALCSAAHQQINFRDMERGLRH